MKILISNDDGVTAEGIRVLATALESIAEVTVMAPDRDRSGASNSLTLRNPIRVQYHTDGKIGVEGTPTDCVHLALTGFLTDLPHMVVSGINDGANMGDDVLYSGTVAAAMEGRYLGFPAMAISLAGETPRIHFATAAHVAKGLIQQLTDNPLPKTTILNVNVPNVPISELRGFAITRLGTRHCAEPTVVQTDPRGKTVYWIGPAGLEADAGIGTDFHAIHEKKVSITPLQIDLTHYQQFEELSTWVSSVPL